MTEIGWMLAAVEVCHSEYLMMSQHIRKYNVVLSVFYKLFIACLVSKFDREPPRRLDNTMVDACQWLLRRLRNVFMIMAPSLRFDSKQHT